MATANLSDRSRIKPEDLLLSRRNLKKVNRKDVYDPGMLLDLECHGFNFGFVTR